MKRRTKISFGVLIMIAGYLFCTGWVFWNATLLPHKRKITVRIAHWQIEKGPPDGIDAVIKRYEELNPDVHVEQMLIPGSVYRQWLRTNLAGGVAPDIIEYGIWLENVSDVPLRYFEPITEYIHQPNPYNKGTPLEGMPWLKTFVDELLIDRIYAPEPGQTYSVTLARGGFRLFTNKTLLKEITGSEEIPQTLEGFWKLCEQVNAYSKRTGRVIHPLAGSKDYANCIMEVYSQGMMVGFSLKYDHAGYHTIYPADMLIEYLKGNWDYHRPELEAGLGVLGRLCAQMKPGFMQLVRDDAIQEFLRSQSLFIFTGSFDSTSLQRLAPFSVGVFRVPQPTKDDPMIGRYLKGHFSDGDDTTGSNLYLNRASPHKKEAIDFMRFLTSQEGGRLFMAHSGWLSSIRGLPVPENLKVYETPYDGWGAGPNYINFGTETRQLFYREFYHMTGPTGSVKEFVDVLESQFRVAAITDLRTEAHNRELTLRPRDVRIAAVGELIRAGEARENQGRRSLLEAAQTQNEGIALYVNYQLQQLAAKQP